MFTLSSAEGDSSQGSPPLPLHKTEHSPPQSSGSESSRELSLELQSNGFEPYPAPAQPRTGPQHGPFQPRTAIATSIASQSISQLGLMDGLAALRQAATQAANRWPLEGTALKRPSIGLREPVQRDDRSCRALPCNHAEPISPLKQRDIAALAGFFQRDDMFALESDIDQHLLKLLPEPCWEDDPFEFLREFL